MYGRWVAILCVLCGSHVADAQRGYRREYQSREAVEEMAIPVWVSSDGDWSNAASWSPAAIPANGDTVLFDGSSQISVTSGLNQTAVNVLQILINPEYTGDIAASGGPLFIAAGSVVHRGPGAVFIRGSHATESIDHVVMDNISGAINIDGKIANVATDGSVWNKAGTLTTGSAMSNSVQNFGNLGNRAVSTIVDGTVVNFYMRAGTASINQVISGVLDQTGGELTVRTNAVSGEIHLEGGTLDYAPQPSVTNTALIAVLGGVFDRTSDTLGINAVQYIIGPDGHVIDNGISVVSSKFTIDLRDDVPVPQ